jgi:hypothetical protein
MKILIPVITLVVIWNLVMIVMIPYWLYQEIRINHKELTIIESEWSNYDYQNITSYLTRN